MREWPQIYKYHIWLSCFSKMIMRTENRKSQILNSNCVSEALLSCKIILNVQIYFELAMVSFKIMEYASSEWVQMLNFPWLFINHFCSISKITFSAKFELPDTSKIFLKLTTVFSFEIWLIFKNFFNSCGVSPSFHQACFPTIAEQI